MNVDAAIFDDEHAYGVGIVIHNLEGAVIAAKAQKNLGFVDVIEPNSWLLRKL